LSEISSNFILVRPRALSLLVVNPWPNVEEAIDAILRVCTVFQRKSLYIASKCLRYGESANSSLLY